MRRRAGARLAILLAVVVGASAAPVAHPSPGLAQVPGIYIALGDSIAAGIGSSLPRTRGYVALVADLLEDYAGAPVPYANLARPGETAGSFLADGQLAELQEEVARAQSVGLPIAAVSVSLGGNEMLELRTTGVTDRQHGLDAFRESYRNALRAIRDAVGPDVPVVVTTYYDLTEGDPSLQLTDAWWIEQFNAVIRDFAQELDARVADLYALFQGKIAEYTRVPFDVHPTNAGHAAIAQGVWSQIGLDETAPVIEIVSEPEIRRTTPTLRFLASDNTGIDAVTVAADGLLIPAPIEVADGEFVVLLDLRGVTTERIGITVEARDAAGNVERTIVEMAMRVAGRGGP